MSEQTKIQWCDSTHNFWQGCTEVSPGCANCYAKARDIRFSDGAHWGKGAPRIRSKSFNEPLKWNKLPWVCNCPKPGGLENGLRFYSDDFAWTEAELESGKPFCAECGQPLHRRRVFSLSLGDIFDVEAPVQDLADAFDVIRRCPNLDWLLVTKRIEHAPARINQVIELCTKTGNSMLGLWLCEWLLEKLPPENVMIISTLESQDQDWRVEKLLQFPAARRGLSIEPMLGPVDLTRVNNDGVNMTDCLRGWTLLDGRNEPVEHAKIDWVIVGGESGQKARPFNVDCARAIVRQCQAAGVPVFVKQFGAKPVYTAAGFEFRSEDGLDNVRAHWHDPKFFIPWNSLHNSAPMVNHPKGGDMAEWPADLRVREFYK